MTHLARLAFVLVSFQAAIVVADEHRSRAPAVKTVSPTRDAVLRRHGRMTGAPSGSPAESTGSESVATASKPSSSAKEVWGSLQAGNRRFVADRPSSKSFRASRAALADGQHPGAVVLACSDSRVSPELIFDQGLGDIFVVRTAGNVADTVALGSIEYAIEHLHSKVLVVLGHDKCGAVTAAASGAAAPSDNIAAILTKINPALADLRTKFSGDELIKRGVVANVHRSARDVLEHSAVLKKAVDAGELTVVEGVYELDTGKVVTQ